MTFSKIGSVALVGCLALGMAACAGTSGEKHGHAMHEAGDHDGKMACEMCAKGKAGETVWCAKCAKGFVGGESTKCEGCYAAKQGGPACEACAHE